MMECAQYHDRPRWLLGLASRGTQMNESDLAFARRVAITVGIVALALAAVALLMKAAQVLLLIFAGILFAVLVRGISDPVSRRTRLPASLSAALVLTLAAALWRPRYGYWRAKSAVSSMS
jgi:hypothetical protein